MQYERIIHECAVVHKRTAFIAITLLMVNIHIPYASLRLFEVLDHWWRYNEIQIYNVSFNKYRP